MSYILQRTSLGWCWLDLIALIVLIGVAVVYYVNIRKMKKYEKELEEKVAGLEAENAVQTSPIQ